MSYFDFQAKAHREMPGRATKTGRRTQEERGGEEIERGRVTEEESSPARGRSRETRVRDRPKEPEV